jgi:hypothetical protein
LRSECTAGLAAMQFANQVAVVEAAVPRWDLPGGRPRGLPQAQAPKTPLRYFQDNPARPPRRPPPARTRLYRHIDRHLRTLLT